jgi:hypothetical protein
MRSIANALTLVVLLICSDSAAAGSSGLGAYEDCILESMKGVNSPKVARAIRQACREKFPLRQAALAPREDRVLSRDELGALTVDAGEFVAPMMSVNASSNAPVAGMRFKIHNPHESLRITELTVSITSAASEKPLEYRATCNVPPKSSGEVIVSFLKTEREGFNWDVVGGRGRE